MVSFKDRNLFLFAHDFEAKRLTNLFFKKSRGKCRILHLPTCVAGFSSSLSRELRVLGVTSTVWSYSPNYLDYQSDFSIFGDSNSKLIKEAKRLLAIRYIFSYDIVVFNYGSTLFSPLGCDTSQRKSPLGNFFSLAFRSYLIIIQGIELYLLKLFRRTIIVVYLGDDARQRDISLSRFSESIAKHVCGDYYPGGSDPLKRSQIALLQKYAKFVYALNPDLLHLLGPGASFLPYFASKCFQYRAHFRARITEPLRFAHAPTNRACKGTDEFVEVIKSLQRQGIRCHLDMIENLSHSEALARYALSHILLDQLYAGWYGTVAVEAMAMGIPAAAFIRDSDLIKVPASMVRELPIIRVSSKTLFADLKAVASFSSDYMASLSLASIQFVRKWHYGPSLARMLLNDWTSTAA